MWVWVGVASVLGLVIGATIGVTFTAILAATHVRNLEHIIEVLGEQIMRDYDIGRGYGD